MPAPFARLASACAAALMILGGTAFVTSKSNAPPDVAAARPAASLEYVDNYLCHDEWRTDYEAASCGLDPAACTQRALSRLQCRKDRSGAAEVLAVACETHDHPAACTSVGVLHSEGLDAPRDPDLARRLHLRACEAGDGIACLNAAALEPVLDFTVELPEAMAEGLKRACDAGVAPACLRARDYWRGCRLGNAESCSWLAFAQERRDDEDEDRRVARGLHAAACEAGMRLGCSRLDELNRENPVAPETYASIVTLFGSRESRLWRDPACLSRDVLGCKGRFVIHSNALIEVAAFRPRRSTDVALTLEPLCLWTNDGRRSVQSRAQDCERLGDIRARFPVADGDGMSALDAYRRACRGGRGTGCRKAAEVMSDLPAGAQDGDAVAALVAEGCEKDDGSSCLRLAVQALELGDTEAAQPLAWRACGFGALQGCMMLATQAGRPGFEPVSDREKARRFSDFCDRGLAEACRAVADLALETGDRRRDRLLDLARACDAGRSDSCEVLRSIPLPEL